MSKRTPTKDVSLRHWYPLGAGSWKRWVARKCPHCGGRVFLHRRRKPFACKTCGFKMPRVLA